MAARKIQADQTRQHDNQCAGSGIILPGICLIDQVEFMQRLELGGCDDLPAQDDDLPGLVFPCDRLHRLTCCLPGGACQFLVVETVRCDKCRHQLRYDPCLGLIQRKADERRDRAQDRVYLLVADAAAHDLLKHAECFLLDGVPAGGSEIYDLLDGPRLQGHFPEGRDIVGFLPKGGICVGTDQGDVLQCRPQSLDLPPGNGRIGGCINGYDRILGGETLVLRTDFADEAASLGRLVIAR